MTGLDFQLKRTGSDTLAVSGALVFANAADALQAMRQALASATTTKLDLAGVRESDSAGLACVLAVLAGAGQTLSVIHVPEGMQALANVCEVEALLS